MNRPAETIKRFRFVLQLPVAALILFMACSFFRSTPTREYYIINYTPTSQVPASSRRPYNYSLQVGRFGVQRIFNRQNIIYRFSPNQIQYYELQRWAVRPDDMIKDMVFKHLTAANLTNNVGIEFFDIKPDYRIEGTVESLEKFDAGDLFFAHLSMSFKLLRVKDGEQIWDYSFDERRQVYSEEMVYTVRGLSSIFQSQMDNVVSQLDSLFLSIGGGIPQITVKERAPQKPAPVDSMSVDLDESAFEIIPEKKK